MTVNDRFIDNHLYCSMQYTGTHSMGFYDNTARIYDAILTRFTTQDPLSEKYPDISPYASRATNPMKYVDNDTIAVNIDCIYSLKQRFDIPISNKVGSFKVVEESGFEIYFKGTNYVWRNTEGKQISPHLKGVPKVLQATYDIETGEQSREPDYIINEKGDIEEYGTENKRFTC